MPTIDKNKQTVMAHEHDNVLGEGLKRKEFRFLISSGYLRKCETCGETLVVRPRLPDGRKIRVRRL